MSLLNTKFDIFTSSTNLVYVKIHLQVLKIIKIQYYHFLYKQKSEKEFNKHTFGNSEFVEHEIWRFH